MTPAKFNESRKTLGLSQTELGKAIGVSPRMIRYYESGEREIPLTVELALEAYEIRHRRQVSEAAQAYALDRIKASYARVTTRLKPAPNPTK